MPPGRPINISSSRGDINETVPADTNCAEGRLHVGGIQKWGFSYEELIWVRGMMGVGFEFILWALRASLSPFHGGGNRGKPQT